MALLVHMQATQPVSECERLLLARRAETDTRLQSAPVKESLAALQSQQAPKAGGLQCLHVAQFM